MRIALIGQAAFGEAVFRALRDAGEQIVAVSSITGSAERPDPLYVAAQDAGTPFFETPKLKKRATLDAFAETRPDLGVMAFVTHILPERVLTLPALGTIQYHPSLLPKHRGISSMHWAIRAGETATGLTVFWVDAGIDTGPILLQREVAIGADDTVGSLYFDKLFQPGVDALVESVRLVREGAAPKIAQDDTQATYDPPASDQNSAIVWSAPARDVYNLVRGSNPTPGAHARVDGKLVRIFDAAFTAVETYPADRNPPGTIMAVDADSIEIALAGGVLSAKRLSLEGSKKLAAAEFAASAGVKVGARFDDGSLGEG
jgi:methionyl-tRNA formyltransferase